jgi:hypothetical protein
MLLIALLLFCVGELCATAPTPLQREVEVMLGARTTADLAVPDDAEAITAAILARDNPGTLFSRYIFGLQGHSGKLLTTEQAGRLKRPSALAVVEMSRSPHWQRGRKRAVLRFDRSPESAKSEIRHP